MRKNFGQAFFLTFLLLVSTWAQNPAPSVKPPQTVNEDDVVRITANLVQLDVTVTDRDGRQVKDLKSEDFEIREEGRTQQITNFSYVEVSPEGSIIRPGEKQSGTPRPPQPPVPNQLPANQVRRTIGIMVDDGAMSFGSVGAVRDSLRKFVDEQIETGDLVGIFRTQTGNRLLQQFTSNQNQLALAARRLAWLPSAENSIDVFEPARRDFEFTQLRKDSKDVTGSSPGNDLKGPERERAEYFDSSPRDPKVIPALRFLISDMRKLPGRKSIVLFSGGLPIYTKRGDPVRTARLLRLLADYANRSGVVIYTVDARGLVNTDYIGADEDIEISDNRTTQLRNARASSLFESQNGLNYLAEKTGGNFAHNNNDLGKGLRRALEEQRGYYLIGYRPSEDTFKEGVRGFRKLEVKLKRPGLRVRTRDGFIGVTDEALQVPKRQGTADSSLYQALASPLASTDIPVRLTPVFGQDAKGNSFLRALLHINTQGINFVDEGNGSKRLKLDVAAVTFGQDGRVIDEFTRTHTVHIPAEALAFVRQNGLVYSTDTPVKAPGAYQFRIVVRDADSKKFGSATQFIEIPDLRKDLLRLSSIVLTEADPGNRQALPPASSAESALSLIQSASSPAVRRFRPGMVLSYSYVIYNSQFASGKRKPQITTQARLFHEGQEVFTGPESSFDPGRQTDLSRINSDGVLTLSSALMAGDYVIQITVKEEAAGNKARVTTQWIDFEIVK